MEKLFIKTELTEDGYCCICDLLPGWIVTFKGNFNDFKVYVQESIDFYVESCKEDGRAYPSIFDEEYEVIYKFDVKSILDHYRGIFSFSALQTITGINQKQLAHYAAGISKPRPAQAEKIANGLHKLAEELAAVTL